MLKEGVLLLSSGFIETELQRINKEPEKHNHPPELRDSEISADCGMLFYNGLSCNVARVLYERALLNKLDYVPRTLYNVSISKTVIKSSVG